MRLPPQPPVLPECSDVHQDGDGTWHATHLSGRRIEADSWERLVIRACAVRVSESLKRAWP